MIVSVEVEQIWFIVIVAQVLKSNKPHNIVFFIFIFQGLLFIFVTII